MSIVRLLSSPSYTLYQRSPRVGPGGFTPLPLAFVADFYVSPTGGTGTGSFIDPWSLSYALSGAGGHIVPGLKGALRGGTYTGTFISGVDGTLANPIIFRQYPGEHANIIGQIRLLTQYIYLWGFEITGAQAPGPISCADMQATGCKLINMVMHDATDEIVGYFHGADSSELYGCIAYNAGPAQASTPNAYSWYGNNVGGRKFLNDCIGFNSYQYITHFYDASLGQLDNITVDGCIGWGGGAIRSPRNTQADLVILGGPGNSIHISNSHFYEGASPELSWCVWIGAAGDDLLLDSNFFVGFTSIGDWTNAIVRNNTFYSLGPTPVSGDLLNVQAPAHISSWQNNKHYRDPNAIAWIRGGAPVAGGIGSNYTNWKAATGLGATDTNPANAPSDTQVFIRANAYELGRANIVIYNWSLSSSVAVNLSSILNIGDRYEIRNVQNFYGSPVVSGVYGGGSVNVPMTGVTPPVPLYGRPYTAAPVTGPQFDTFVVTRV